VLLDYLHPVAFAEDGEATTATDERLASVGGHWLPASGNLDGLGMHVEKLMTGVLPYLLEVVTFHACDRDHVGIAEV